MDSDRCGNLPFVFEENFGFDTYVEYSMDVPMYFVYRSGKGYINAMGQSWRDFMEGKLPALPGKILLRNEGGLVAVKDYQSLISAAYSILEPLWRFL